MIGLVYILKTILYYVFLIIAYVVSSHYNKNNKKLSFAIIIFLSLMISTYSFISTAHPYVMDKRVYAIKCATYDKKKKKEPVGLLFISVVLNIALIGAVIWMFWIATHTDNPNIINYETVLTNRYASWDQELTERERQVRLMERELGINTESLDLTEE